MFGTESLVMCKTNDDHSFQRHLVGASLTPDAIERANASLQKSVTEQLDKIFDHPTTVMEHICTNFTLDVAWRQILGLNLKEAEIPSFTRRSTTGLVVFQLSGATATRNSVHKTWSCLLPPCFAYQ